MRNAIISFYDAFPEQVVSDVRENMRTDIYCADLPPGRLGLIGAASGTVVSRRCPVGPFLTGWLIAESDSDIASAQPICRQFQ